MANKILLPNSNQFDLMNAHLAKIATALGGQVDVSTWEGVQRAVRMGIAPNILPVGTQLVVHHSVYGDRLYDVVAHNYLKSARNAESPTMTLLSHDILARMQYDAPEAFYYAKNAPLPAGTYNFTLATSIEQWTAGTYYFTLGQELPQGGCLCINGNPSAPMEGGFSDVTAYSSLDASVQIGSYLITPGSNGTSLGTFGVELNHVHRVAWGSNNYSESAIRQYLNSTAEAGKVWQGKTKFDRPPSWAATTAGFAAGFDDDFLAVVGEVVLPCVTNSTYETPESTQTPAGQKYKIAGDKFYLASLTEVFGTTNDVLADDSVKFPYYQYADGTISNVTYTKYISGAPTSWWLRTPINRNAGGVSIITSGNVSAYQYASNSYGVVPACTIV